MSSQAAAGPAPSRERPINEDDVPRPVEPYGRSKLEAERVVHSFSDRVAATIVRPCSVFGPYNRAFLPLFRLAEHGVVLYPGIAQHWASMLHVDDVVTGLLLVARRDTSICRTFFLASDEPVQWRTLGEHIADAVGRRVRHMNVHPALIQSASVAADWIGRLTQRSSLANRSKAALSRHQYWICSAARARSELAFRESRSLPEAIRDTYNWYCRSGWLRGSHGAGSAVA